jgi:hypothetical protein
MNLNLINMKKLSPAQQKVVDKLKEDPTAYVVASEFWDFQILSYSNGKKQSYFKRRTREFLVGNGILTPMPEIKNGYKLA